MTAIIVTILYFVSLFCLFAALSAFLWNSTLKPGWALRMGNVVLIAGSVPLLLKPELPKDYVLMPAMVELSSSLALIGMTLSAIGDVLVIGWRTKRFGEALRNVIVETRPDEK